MYVKCESFNPLASVKDRLAIAIIEDAERRGALKPGQTVVEATSGNTGIALAMVCAAKGYPFVAVMAESFSIERRKLMRMLGAKVILTPAAERGTGMVRKAEELAKKHGWFLARQFENQANPAYHRSTTGPEILRDFAGKRLDYFVTGWGTGGTLTGAGEMLRLARPGREDHRGRARGRGAAVAASRWRRTRSRAGRRTSCRRCSIARSPHRIVPVTDAEAIDTARVARAQEGIFCGISSRRAPSPPRCRWRAKHAPGSRDPGDAARHRRALPVDRRCSRASPTAPTLKPESRRPRCDRLRELAGAAMVCAERAAAGPVHAVSGRRAARRAHRLRDLGPAERRARQRDPDFHGPVAARRTRPSTAAGPEPGLVGSDDRPRRAASTPTATS